jgi:hypothetical protein
MKHPLLEVKQYKGEGRNDWALFRSDQEKPMCYGISKAHADHLKTLCLRVEDLPAKIEPIDDWYNYDHILTDEEMEKL